MAMNQEPNVEDACALWAEIVKQPRPHRVVDFPRKRPDGTPIGTVALIVLTQGDNMASAAEAEKTTRKITAQDKGETSREVYTLAVNCEVLFRACKDPNDPKLERPFFRSVSDIRKFLTVDEIAVLMNLYLEFRRATSPIMGELDTDEEVEAWISTLALGGNFDPLASASLGLLRRCVTVMASRLYGSPTDRSSPGSQPNTGETSAESSPTDSTSL